LAMTVSNAPDGDVLLTSEERLAWASIERALRGSDLTRGAALLAHLRRIGWQILLSYAHLYLPPDMLTSECSG